MSTDSEQPRPTRRRIAGERGRRGAAGDSGESAPPASARARPKAPPPTRPARPPRPPSGGGFAGYWWWLAPLVVLAVLAVVAAGIAFWRWESADAGNIDAARDQASSAAQEAAEAVLSFDYRTLDDDAAAAEGYLTDGYAEEYRAGIESLINDAAQETKGRVQAEVKAVGVVPCGQECSDTSVDVLVFVDQVSRTSADPEPQTALNRVVFTMQKVGDRWLVDDVVPL